MRWPWTSVARLDDAKAEIAHLRESVARLEGQLTRIVRKDAGLSEVPIEPRKKLEPMPSQIRAYVDGLWHAGFRKETSDGFYRRHARGETWQSIEDSIELQRVGPQDEPGEGSDAGEAE